MRARRGEFAWRTCEQEGCVWRGSLLGRGVRLMEQDENRMAARARVGDARVSEELGPLERSSQGEVGVRE